MYEKSDRPLQQDTADNAPPALGSPSADLKDGHQLNMKSRPTVHFEDKPPGQVPEAHHLPNRETGEVLSNTEAAPNNRPHCPHALFQSGALQSLLDLLFTAECVFNSSSRNHTPFTPPQFSWFCNAVL